MLADIGIFGLGTMGENLCLNLVEKGFKVSIYNRTEEKTRKFYEKNRSLAIIPTYNLKDFVESIKKPRKILLLIKAGDPVDEAINHLLKHVEKNDIIIDAGNSHFKDSDRRYSELKKVGVNFFGIGISGGVEGARKGLSIMAGGSKEAFDEIKEILEKISAKYNGEPCFSYFGEGGSGHFVKIIHNGIEYALIESISEIFFLLSKFFDHEKISEIFNEWNKSILSSFLLSATVNILRKKENGKFLIDYILDKAEQKGTGKWSVEISLETGIPAPAIAAAVFSRYISMMKESRVKYSKLYNLSKITNFSLDLEDIKKTLLVSILLSYIQGIYLLKGSSFYNYKINVSEALRIWRAGCIIRGEILNLLYKEYLNYEDILLSNNIKNILLESFQSFLKTLSFAFNNHLPFNVISANYNYFIMVINEKLPANLTQALRDYFGAHGYKRIDKEGYFHTEWY
ncbi:MAG: NADP-dependent phosphogluconate dehydrogenase [Thermoproteota archaeon]|jgi:6-phosphogluconate dehydrogenase